MAGSAMQILMLGLLVSGTCSEVKDMSQMAQRSSSLRIDIDLTLICEVLTSPTATWTKALLPFGQSMASRRCPMPHPEVFSVLTVTRTPSSNEARVRKKRHESGKRKARVRKKKRHESGKRKSTSQEEEKARVRKKKGTSQEKEKARVRKKKRHESGRRKGTSQEKERHESGNPKSTSQENARESGKRPRVRKTKRHVSGKKTASWEKYKARVKKTPRKKTTSQGKNVHQSGNTYESGEKQARTTATIIFSTLREVKKRQLTE